MPRFRSTSTGVVVVVADGKHPGSGWESASVDSQPPQDNNVCDVCGFEAKSAGGLGSHRRSHEEG